MNEICNGVANMPVYLVFLRVVARRGLKLALTVVQTCPLCLKLANCDRGPGPEEIFFSYVSYCPSVR